MASNWSYNSTQNRGDHQNAASPNFAMLYGHGDIENEYNPNKDQSARLGMTMNPSLVTSQSYSGFEASYNNVMPYHQPRIERSANENTSRPRLNYNALEPFGDGGMRSLNKHHKDAILAQHANRENMRPADAHKSTSPKASTNLSSSSRGSLQGQESQEMYGDSQDLANPNPRRKMEDDLLIKLRTTSNCSWKEIVSIFETSFGPKYTVPMLQMRFYRLRKQMRF